MLLKLLLLQPGQRISVFLEWGKQLEVAMPVTGRGWRRLDLKWVADNKSQIKRDKHNQQLEWDKTHNKQMRQKQQDKVQEYPSQVASHWNQQEQLQPKKRNHQTQPNPRCGKALLPICVNSTSQARSSRRRSPKSTQRKRISPHRKRWATTKHLTKKASRVLWLATRMSPTTKLPNSMAYCFNRSWTENCWRLIILLP